MTNEQTIRDHHGGSRACPRCHEPWPCRSRRLAENRLLRADAAARRPQGAPKGSASG
jgi:hypothetical protein